MLRRKANSHFKTLLIINNSVNNKPFLRPINNKINLYTNNGRWGWWSPHCIYSAGVGVGKCVCGGCGGGGCGGGGLMLEKCVTTKAMLTRSNKVCKSSMDG